MVVAAGLRARLVTLAQITEAQRNDSLTTAQPITSFPAVGERLSGAQLTARARRRRRLAAIFLGGAGLIEGTSMLSLTLP